MKSRRTTLDITKGFTLIEVLVAFSILSLTLAALFSLLSAGTRSTRVAGEYGDAMVHAESMLAQLGVTEVLRPGTTRGRFDEDFMWTLTVTKRPRTEHPERREIKWDLLDVTLRVSWRSMGGERDVELSTVRLAAGE